VKASGALRHRGVTLIELAVAMMSASILISIVFFTWNQITRSTTIRQRRTALQSECSRVARLITGQIQKADAVLQYDRNSIRLVTREAKDTVTFSLNGTTIERDNTPLSFTLPDVTVDVFSFENQNSEHEGQPYLFLFTLTLISAHNDTASVESTVMGRRMIDGTAQSGTDFMW
jgi:Tfp pilus assembly protein PilE